MEYAIGDVDSLWTPAVVVYPRLVRANLERVLSMAGRADKLRPHSKTHKTAELTRIEIDAGIQKHKCATLAEAQVLAEAGATDVLIAYPLVGPNIARLADLARRFPTVSWRTLADHPVPVALMRSEFADLATPISVLIDLDVGMHRTGVEIGDAAYELCMDLAGGSFPARCLEFGGLHIYDGHVRDPGIAERRTVVRRIWNQVSEFVRRLENAKVSVPRIVCGGTPTFPCWSEIAEDDPRVECSPGTFFLNDASYFATYGDLPMKPAALVVGRVVSKPQPGEFTCDLGSKSVAPDSSLENRLQFLNVPDARLVKQSEEHLTVAAPNADHLIPGDLVYAVPGHICPTCALHKELVLVEDGAFVGAWPVRARDRSL